MIRQPELRRYAVWTAMGVLAAWLLSPACAPVHVEGFSASIVAIGLHFAQGTVRDFLPFAPFNTDYFGLTKFGAVLGVAILSPLFGGEGAMRVMLALALIVTLASTAYLVKVWTGARWWIVAVVLLVMPGIVESAFYHNDNLPAAAALLTGLCVLERWRSIRATLVAGMLIGLAASVRTDSVLVAIAAVPAIVWAGEWRAFVVRGGIAGLTALATWCAVLAIAGVTPIDVIAVGRFAVTLWDRPPGGVKQLVELLLFTGLPVTLALLFGVWALGRRAQWRRLAFLVGVPLVYDVVLLGAPWQARQFVVLAPFVASLAVCGVQAAVDAALGERPVPLIVWGALCLTTFAAPVKLAILSDGPHAVMGRVAGIRLWTSWQRYVRRDFALIDRMIGSARADRTLIVLTDGWDDDRYLHLRLVERGFRRAVLPRPCAAIGEAFARRGTTIVTLSLRTTFVRNWATLQPERLDRIAIPCIAHRPDAAIVLLGGGRRVAALLDRPTTHRSALSAIEAAGFDPMIAASLDRRALPGLVARYRETAVRLPGPALGATPALLASRTAFSR